MGEPILSEGGVFSTPNPVVTGQVGCHTQLLSLGPPSREVVFLDG